MQVIYSIHPPNGNLLTSSTHIVMHMLWVSLMSYMSYSYTHHPMTMQVIRIYSIHPLIETCSLPLHAQ